MWMRTPYPSYSLRNICTPIGAKIVPELSIVMYLYGTIPYTHVIQLYWCFCIYGHSDWKSGISRHVRNTIISIECARVDIYIRICIGDVHQCEFSAIRSSNSIQFSIYFFSFALSSHTILKLTWIWIEFPLLLQLLDNNKINVWTWDFGSNTN